MAKKKRIAVVGESDSMRGFLWQHHGNLVYGGWFNERHILAEIKALKEMGEEDMYGVIVVDIKDWRAAEAMGERIHDELTALGVTIRVAVLDDRKIIEKKPKVTMVPRREAEVVAMARMFGIIK